MRSESVPAPPSPEEPPLAPYDPPEPAPQAAAWRRALKVVVRRAGAKKGNGQIICSGSMERAADA